MERGRLARTWGFGRLVHMRAGRPRSQGLCSIFGVVAKITTIVYKESIRQVIVICLQSRLSIMR